MKKGKATRKAPGSHELIFVVDDNVLLGEFAGAVLQGAGYDIQSFTDPKAVLKAMRTANPKPVALVTDYEMGEMNGLELIVSSHKILPLLKTVLTSGSIDDAFVARHPAKVNKFLGKPYQAAQLKDTIGQLLHP